MSDEYSDSSNWDELLETPPGFDFIDNNFPKLSFITKDNCATNFQEDDLLSIIQPSTFDFLNEDEINEIEKSRQKIIRQQMKDEKVKGNYVIKPVEFTADSIKFEYYFKEVPSRCIMITNIPSHATTEDLKYIFDKFGEYETFDLSNISKGMATVQYYNLEDAQTMRVSTIYIRNQQIMMVFHLETSVLSTSKNNNHIKKAQNNGTIVVFHIPKSVDENGLNKIFSQYGKIRQIRNTPSKANQKFIEFYDKRSAEKALKALNGKQLMKDTKKISIEFSFPGGFKKNIEKYFRTTLPTVERNTNSRTNVIRI